MATRAAEQASAEILRTCLQLVKDAGGLSRSGLKRTLQKLDYNLTDRLMNLRVNSVLLRAQSSQLLQELDGNLVITREGAEKLKKLVRVHDLKTLKDTVWDKKWRLLSYDIPEQDRQLRDELRFLIKQADFTLLQRSIWITPYPCEKHLEELLHRYPDYLQLFIVDSILGDDSFSSKYRTYLSK